MFSAEFAINYIYSVTLNTFIPYILAYLIQHLGLFVREIWSVNSSYVLILIVVYCQLGKVYDCNYICVCILETFIKNFETLSDPPDSVSQGLLINGKIISLILSKR